MQRERNQVLREVINNLFQAARKKLAFPAVEVHCWGLSHVICHIAIDRTQGVLDTRPNLLFNKYTYRFWIWTKFLLHLYISLKSSNSNIYIISKLVEKLSLVTM